MEERLKKNRFNAAFRASQSPEKKSVVQEGHMGRFLKKMRQRRAMLRLVGFVLLLNTVLAFFLTILFSAKYQKEMRRSFIENSESLVAGVETSINLMLDDILDVGRLIYNDRIIDRFVQTASMQRYDEIKAMIDKMASLKTSSRFVDSVYVYSAVHGRIYSSIYGLTDIEDTPDQEFLGWMGKKGAAVQIIDTHPVYSSRYSKQQYMDAISVLVKIPFAAGKRGDGAVIFNINQREIYSQVLERMEEGTQKPFLILDQENRVIVSGKEGLLYQNSSNVSELSGMKMEEKGSYVTEIDGERYLAVYATLSEVPWKVVSFYSMEDMDRIISEMREIIFLFALAGIAVTIAVGTVWGNRETRELDELLYFVHKKTGTSNKNRSLSLSFAELRDEIKSCEEMKRQLDKSRILLKERFLVSLIHGTQKDDEIQKNLETFHVRLRPDRIIVGVMQLENYDEKLKGVALEAELTDLSIRRILSRFPKDAVEVFHTDIAEIVFLMDGGSLHLSEISSIFHRIEEEIENVLDMKARIGICGETADICHIRSAFRNAKEALRYSRFWKRGLIYYNDIKTDGDNRLSYPFERQQRIGKAIRLCDRSMAKEALREFLEAVYADSSLAEHRNSSMILLLQFNSYLINQLNDLNLSFEEIYRSENIMRNLAGIQSFSEAEFFFGALLDKIISVYEKGRMDKQSRYYYSIMNCLSECYMDPGLSLEVLSDRVQISSSYINQILKEREGKTFTQALNEKRIEKACELLDQGGLQIQEIAERVGYTSSKYFISVFKKMMGRTPGSFQ